MSTTTALEPNDLLLYARVVDEGSFSRAGERLGLPKSTVSRRLAGLEAQLGERLLLRTTGRPSRAGGCACPSRATSPTGCSAT